MQRHYLAAIRYTTACNPTFLRGGLTTHQGYDFLYSNSLMRRGYEAFIMLRSVSHKIRMFQPDKTLDRTLKILDSSKTCSLLVMNKMITDTRHRVKFETECTKIWTVRRGDVRAAPFPGSGQAEWRLFLAGPYYL